MPGPGLFSFKLFSETHRGYVSKNESETQFNDLAVRNTFLIDRKVNSVKVYLKVRSRPHTEQRSPISQNMEKTESRQSPRLAATFSAIRPPHLLPPLPSSPCLRTNAQVHPSRRRDIAASGKLPFRLQRNRPPPLAVAACHTSGK
jgi:hypothetical protein